MMTEKYYNSIWVQWFYRFLHAIPLRENSFYNVMPLKAGLNVLKNGNVIGIFPEGGISRTGFLQIGKPGTLLLAQKSGTSILPAFISGTFQALPRHAKFFSRSKIKVIFGSPITYEEISENLRGKLGLQKATQNLIKKISELGSRI